MLKKLKKKLRFLAMDFGELIDEYIKKKNDDDVHYKVRGKYSPSDLGKSCMLQSYFKSTTEQIEWAPEKLRIFEAGNLIHDFCQKVVAQDKKFEFVETESKFFAVVPDEKELITISGRADIICREKGSEELVVFEIKSIKDLYYRRDSPMPEHVNQILLYMGCLHSNEGYIVYVNKDNLETITHKIEYDHKKFLDILTWIRRLHYHVIAENPPEAEFDPEKTRWPCEYCSFEKQRILLVKKEKDSETEELLE